MDGHTHPPSRVDVRGYVVFLVLSLLKSRLLVKVNLTQSNDIGENANRTALILMAKLCPVFFEH